LPTCRDGISSRRSGIFFPNHQLAGLPENGFDFQDSIFVVWKFELSCTSRAVLLSRPAGSRVPSAHRVTRAGQTGRSRGLKAVYDRDKEGNSPQRRCIRWQASARCARRSSWRVQRQGCNHQSQVVESGRELGGEACSRWHYDRFEWAREPRGPAPSDCRAMRRRPSFPKSLDGLEPCALSPKVRPPVFIVWPCFGQTGVGECGLARFNARPRPG
jgi:hypothetical protein